MEPAPQPALPSAPELPQPLAAYLLARGLSDPAILAACATDEADFKANITQPFLDGWTGRDETVHKRVDSDGDALLVSAQLLAAFRRAQAPRPPSRPDTPPPAPLATVPPAATSARPPTSLAPGEWRKQVEAFERAWNPPRVFPVKVILGAEAVLARLLHELNVTRMFTPLGLGEILKSRAYSANGQVNNLATRRTDTLGIVRGATSGFEIVDQDRPFLPDSVWGVLDGLESVKWAFTWAGYGTDEDSEVWVSYFRGLTRLRPQHLDFVRSFYDAASWRLCLDMRGGLSFAAASQAIVSDAGFRDDYDATYRPDRRRGRNERDDRGRDRSRRGRGDRDRADRPRRGAEANRDRGEAPAVRMDESRWHKTHNGKDICKNFNRGRCRLDACRREHVCGICRRDHAARECPQRG